MSKKWERDDICVCCLASSFSSCPFGHAHGSGTRKGTMAWGWWFLKWTADFLLCGDFLGKVSSPGESVVSQDVNKNKRVNLSKYLPQISADIQSNYDLYALVIMVTCDMHSLEVYQVQC